ncbi:DUF3231 family protein [Bacillales bacterium AN1005]|uniref:DUF3231 family protein n=1 Tax=Niallia taxi TaxID=2499688 RepID=UPI0021A47AF1|nr:DUF3231 family protein [Niallia taxi]MCT2345963.1 DUF3231 family protein [Niallia taxi]
MKSTPSITSSEIGILWMSYQQKTMVMRFLEYFIEQAEDPKAKDIMTDLLKEITPYVKKIQKIYEKENVPVPVGFTSKDVNLKAPKLFDNGFDIMFIRLIKEISMGMHTLNLTMAYRSDIMVLFRELTIITQKYYDRCNTYLLEKGLLPRAPYVAVEEGVEFAEEKGYLNGNDFFSERRSLNTVEITHLFHGVETNLIGLQVINGFSQCAEEKEVSNYFAKGGELAKEIATGLGDIILKNDTQLPGFSGGNVTASTIPPFSDKMMMYCISLFCSFSLGGNSLGTAFSLRNDLPAKFSIIMKDVFDYAHEGAKLMIKHGWMEEPPQTIKMKAK